MMASGEPLAEVQREAEQALGFFAKGTFRSCRRFNGRAADPGTRASWTTNRRACLRDLDQNEASLERRLSEGGARLALAASRYWICKLQTYFFVRDIPRAVAAAMKARDLVWSRGNSWRWSNIISIAPWYWRPLVASAPDEQRQANLERDRGASKANRQVGQGLSGEPCPPRSPRRRGIGKS